MILPKPYIGSRWFWVIAVVSLPVILLDAAGVGGLRWMSAELQTLPPDGIGQWLATGDASWPNGFWSGGFWSGVVWSGVVWGGAMVVGAGVAAACVFRRWPLAVMRRAGNDGWAANAPVRRRAMVRPGGSGSAHPGWMDGQRTGAPWARPAVDCTGARAGLPAMARAGAGEVGLAEGVAQAMPNPVRPEVVMSDAVMSDALISDVVISDAVTPRLVMSDAVMPGLVVGARADDLLLSARADDLLLGAPADDLLLGAPADVALASARGDDLLASARGDVALLGARADDLVLGARADDLLVGRAAAGGAAGAAAASGRDNVVALPRTARLDDLAEMADLAAVMTRDFNGAIRFWSRGCTEMYGWRGEEAVGQCPDRLLGSPPADEVAAIEQALLQDGSWAGDLAQVRRDGGRIVVAARMVLKRDAQGRPWRVIAALCDVTASRTAAQTMAALETEIQRRVQAELAARTASFAQAAHADRVQALGQLAGGIAHDFNNVLQAVSGASALIGRRVQDAAVVERMNRVIADAVVRGSAITRRMLLLARRGDLRAERLAVAWVLEGIRSVLAHTLGASVRVVIEVDAAVAFVMADKAQLEMALLNLATNARDAMPGQGVLRLTATREVVAAGRAGLVPGVYLRLAVIDDGSGMTPDTLARAGEPFFTTKDVGKGTGLGLPMVKAFAAQSGGDFALESVRGAGTSAILWLPAVDGAVAPVGAAVPPAANTNDERARIMVVDDDALVRETLTEQLEAMGHDVAPMSDGAAALAWLRGGARVDLMITDLSMPGMNGLALIEAARGMRPDLKSILLTGFPSEIAALDGEAGLGAAYTLVRKPATSAALGSRISVMLRTG